MPLAYDGPYIDARCDVCDAKLVSQRHWNAAGATERREMAHEGYARQGVGPRCHNCSRRTK